MMMMMMMMMMTQTGRHDAVVTTTENITIMRGRVVNSSGARTWTKHYTTGYLKNMHLQQLYVTDVLHVFM